MTYVSPGISPARLRIEAAGRAFQEREAIEAARRIAEQRRARAIERAEQIIQLGRRRIRCRDIAVAISDERGVGIEEIRGNSRRRCIAVVRQEVMWACSKAGHSLKQIGSFLGKDHTTVLHGVRQHEQRLEESKRAGEAAR